MLANDTYSPDLANTHWWWRARGLTLERLLNRWMPDPLWHDPVPHILDVGCGVGTYMPLLRRYGRVTGLDISREALRHCPPGFDTVQGSVFSLHKDMADVIVSLDMLEHLEDDIGALACMTWALRPGGLMFLAVPASPSLWSGHDERLGHYRRYTRESLTSLARSCGLDVLDSLYAMGLIYPIARIQRALMRSPSNGTPEGVNLPGWLNKTVEVIAAAPARLPFGTSVFMVARRPRDGQ